MSYSATMVLPCRSCGAECHVIIECDDDPQALKTVPIICCECSKEIGRVPGVAVASYPTAREALSKWLVEAPHIRELQKRPSKNSPEDGWGKSDKASA